MVSARISLLLSLSLQESSLLARPRACDFQSRGLLSLIFHTALARSLAPVRHGHSLTLSCGARRPQTPRRSPLSSLSPPGTPAYALALLLRDDPRALVLWSPPTHASSVSAPLCRLWCGRALTNRPRYAPYEIQRQMQLASEGYVTMSANIYGLPVGQKVDNGTLQGQYAG
eukprot:3113856-Rhodomonas_salina.5